MEKRRAERYRDFFCHRFLPQCWGDIKASVAEQVVGIVLAFLILIAQIQLGVISKDAIRVNFLAIAWPYAALIGMFVVYHTLRAPWLVSNSHMDAISELKTELTASKGKLDALEKAKPRIKLKDPDAVYTEPVVQRFKNQHNCVIRTQVDRFLKVRFINDPETSSPSAKAKEIIATIDYYRCPDNAHVLSIDGRWSESTQPSGLSPLESKVGLLPADFVHGQQRSLDIAYRDGHSGKYYAWNNDNYNYVNQSYVYEKHLLDGKHFRVEIRLRGENVDERFSFEFRTSHAEKAFDIERNPTPFLLSIPCIQGCPSE